MSWLVVDVATAAIDGAGSFLDPVSAPSNWKDPEKIAAYVAEKTAEREAHAALDLDLARLTAIGTYGQLDEAPAVGLLRTEDEERGALRRLATRLDARLTLVTYSGFSFDLPVLMRRAKYLGVPFPKLNLDRYRSPHVDVMLELSYRDPSRRRSLGFYVRRHGWTDLAKPLEGAEESQVHQSGRWDELLLSVGHDLLATARLARWEGLIHPATPLVDNGVGAVVGL